MPCFLRIEKPVKIDEDIFAIVDIGDFNRIIEKIKGLGYIKNKRTFYKFLSEIRNYGYFFRPHFFSEDFYKLLKNEFLKGGFDGVIYENEIEGESSSYCVFSPRQIKSLYNWGTFNLKSDNIME